MRSALRRQPAIPAFGQAAQETRERAGNPAFSRIWFCLWPPNAPIIGHQLPKVSGHDPEYSRFAETIGGDRYDPDCRPTVPESFLSNDADPQHAFVSRGTRTPVRAGLPICAGRTDRLGKLRHVCDNRSGLGDAGRALKVRSSRTLPDIL